MQDFKDKELTSTIWSNKKGHVAQARQQGEYETLHRDLNIGFGKWDFSLLDLENPFPNNEASVHLLWHREEDLMVPVIVQRYIAENLPWIQYHELKGSGHLFLYLDGMSDTIIKSLLGAK
ncbi:hypothetical protein HN51_061857 [Arachis hypogaea]|uniref:uncharacterized protein LOC110268555 n=1 Tax=Arachis ipaensis TaxID=130454 RepID=UPI000A2B29FC|nr:uncharacterized protein LOC110268555 [Arachis ipaensis]QHO19216.1 uncharacterized protein DS421_11g326960 [Arachis hypogaea]